MTGFHLKDIFDSTKKITEIKRKIYDQIILNKRFPKTLEISFEPVKQKEEEKNSKN